MINFMTGLCDEKCYIFKAVLEVKTNKHKNPTSVYRNGAISVTFITPLTLIEFRQVELSQLRYHIAEWHVKAIRRND